MSDKSLVESTRDYFLTCPVIDVFTRIGVDYLDADPTGYTIDSVPADPVIKKYMDGETLRQYVFVFGSKESYGPDIWKNLDNLGFYEKLVKWFENQTESNILPTLPAGLTAQSIEALSTPYLYDTSEDQARYQIQVRITYHQK